MIDKSMRVSLKKPLLIGLAVLISCSGLTALLSIEPNYSMEFKREIPVARSLDEVKKAMSSISRWYEWFYSTSSTTLVSGPNQDLPTPGQIVRFQIDPSKGPWKKFTVDAEVKSFDSAGKLTLSFVEDSKRSLNAQFKSLSWEIELFEKQGKPWVKVISSAETAHWRSRLFGRIARRILMNNATYPNLFKLAEVKQPEEELKLFPR